MVFKKLISWSDLLLTVICFLLWNKPSLSAQSCWLIPVDSIHPFTHSIPITWTQLFCLWVHLATLTLHKEIRLLMTLLPQQPAKPLLVLENLAEWRKLPGHCLLDFSMPYDQKFSIFNLSASPSNSGRQPRAEVTARIVGGGGCFRTLLTKNLRGDIPHMTLSGLAQGHFNYAIAT